MDNVWQFNEIQSAFLSFFSAKEEIKTKNSDHTMEENYRKLLEAREKCDSLVRVYTGISQSLR